MGNAQARQPFDKSWGADLDRGRRPGVPKELNEENGSSGHSSHWARKTRQVPSVKIHQTIERPGLTPVFGTSSPPKYLSGFLRDVAYTYSEDKMRHWMLLVFADRINMVEGWVEDIFRGKMPMILPRMEFRTADMIRNPATRAKGLRNVAVMAGVAGIAAYLLLRPKRKLAVMPAYKPPKGFRLYESTPDLP